MREFMVRTRPAMPDVYAIHVRGALDPQWSTWFDGLTITHDPDGSTILHGAVVDQTALYGLIGKAHDLGLTLLAITRSEPHEER